MYTLIHSRQMRGITLIEVVVWVSIFSLVMVTLTSALLSFYRSNAYTIEQTQAVESARRGITIALREIRELQYASNGAYPIVSTASSSMTFYSDVDGDSHIERVTYEVEEATFVRRVLDPSGSPLAYSGTPASKVVSDQVRNLANSVTAFTYYDASGTEVTDLSRVQDVRFVRLDLVINVNPKRLPNELTIRSSAALRNLTGQ